MGTIINDGRITSGSGETLSENDKISFGAHVEDGEPMCKLVWRPLVFSASGFKKTAKAKLKETCVGMGVSIDDSQKIPADARYLLMTELTVTQKVVVALARGIEIVSERFLDALDRKVSFLNFAFPAASKYLPEEKETNVIGQAIGWGPNPARKNLFKGVQFLTLIDTMQKRVQETVELCGGKVICMPLTAETSLDEIIAVAKQPNTLVLTNSRNDSQDMGYEYDHAFEMLRGLGKRVIEEQEVAYAVLAASREEHTNPDIDYDPLSKYESQQSSIGGTGEVRDNVPVASSARHRPNQAVASTQAVPKQAPPDAATSATSQAAILAPATQSGPQAPEIRKVRRQPSPICQTRSDDLLLFCRRRGQQGGQ